MKPLILLLLCLLGCREEPKQWSDGNYANKKSGRICGTVAWVNTGVWSARYTGAGAFAESGWQDYTTEAQARKFIEDKCK